MKIDIRTPYTGHFYYPDVQVTSSKLKVMSALSKTVYISPEAYLLGENDRVDGIKYEYVNGKVYAMAGASRAHNIVAGEFFATLRNHLRGSPCRAYQSDMKVGIRALREDHFYYPDVQVTW